MKRPMVEWLMLDGSPDPMWVAWARSKARFLYDAGGRQQQRYALGDGTSVSIQFVNENAYIRVNGGGEGYYQFFGSGPILLATTEDPVISGRYPPLGYAATATAKKVFKPRVSSALESDSGKWVYNADPAATNDYLGFTPHHQPDLMSVREWFWSNSAGKAQGYPRLMTQWQQNHPCSGMGVISGGSSQYTVVNDYGYDYGPILFESVGAEGVNKSPDSDWYGQACLFTATDETFGQRRFIIMVDVNSRFYAYPTEGYGDTILFGTYPGQKGNVPASMTQSVACPWPAWVSDELLGIAAIDAGDALSDQVERMRPLWSFSNDGSRAACIMGNRADPWADAYFTSNDPYVPSRDVKEDMPGLVEVEFTLALTGTGAADFTFDVVLRQDIYSGTDPFAPVAVAYAIKEMGDIPSGALLMLDYEHYTDNLGCAVPEVDPKDGLPDIHDLTRPNLATVARIKWQEEESGDWSIARSWLAWYGCFPGKIGDQYTSTVLESFAFSPLITDFSELPSGDVTYNHLSYLGQIVALDLRSASVLVAATVQTQGKVSPIEDPLRSSDAADGAALVAIMFNAEVQRKTIGHPLVKEAASTLFDLTASNPVLASMTQFYPNATLDGVRYDPGSSTMLDDFTYYSTLTVRDGNGGSSSSLVRHAAEVGLGDLTTSLSGFTGALEIHGPRIFSFFDGRLIIRPGFRWRDSGGLVAGEASFYAYPWGAIQHNRVLTHTLTAINGNPRIVVHPDGSYAYQAGPFAAHLGIHPMYGESDNLLIQDDYEQAFLDRIMHKKAKEPTTHREALSGAFPGAFGEGGLTDSDYEMEVRRIADTPDFQFHIDSPKLTQTWYGTTVYVPCVVGPLLQATEYLLSRIYTDRAIEIQYYIDAEWTYAPRPFYEGVFYGR